MMYAHCTKTKAVVDNAGLRGIIEPAVRALPPETHPIPPHASPPPGGRALLFTPKGPQSQGDFVN